MSHQNNNPSHRPNPTPQDAALLRDKTPAPAPATGSSSKSLPGSPPGSPPASDDAQLAHELANLLDGSLRNISLAIAQLSSEPAPDASEEKLLTKLHTANQAMQQMANLIQTWMKPTPTQQADAYHWPGPLGEAVKHIVKLTETQASDLNIAVNVQFDEGAAALPCGPIYFVLTNAMRNSIEAIQAVPRDPSTTRDEHQITLTAQLHNQQVCIEQTDTGQGLDPSILDAQGQGQLGQTTKPHGHGIGLELSDKILRHLGGHLQLLNAPKQGAILKFSYPITAVTLP